MRAAYVFVLLSAAGPLAAQQSSDKVWIDVKESDARAASRGLARTVVPTEFRTLRIDHQTLDSLLRSAPEEASTEVNESQTILQLPLPDGRFQDFRIVESPIMEPGLAARYPHIRTWLGQGVQDPTATVRIDQSHKGLHAQIISWQGTVLVDPWMPGDAEYAIVYNKRDAQRPGERAVCAVTGEPLDANHDHAKHALGIRPKISSGATLRTHRLAMAATGEYTQFHGGTVADGLAAIVTTMNRVNGIYERELAVRMVLVANNDLIIYTDGGTDPYTNGNGSTMLGQNQTNLTTVIGAANYDIGHVVSTGGGGVASLGSVCSASNKARGVTGQSSPIGDVFDVDFVAHEVGHQYAGRHAFNGSGGNCSGGNRSAGSAYEPGSGITIQSYAGICGADNLQPNSEDYFHRVSLNEMLTFTTTGGGSSCGSTSATGNTPPTVSTAATFSIPQLTPFMLSATGSDANGDGLTYIWEQFDLGAANAAGSLIDDGSRPIFRSFIPTLETTRIFPSLRYILNNANAVPATAPLPGTTTPARFTGEVLPSTNRTLNFRVTARDNRAGGGGTNEAATAITVTNTAGPFRVTAPNTAVTVNAGDMLPVTWDVANTTSAPISTTNVQIALSYDGGLSFPVEFGPFPNSGTASITLPASTATSRARIRVAAVGNIFFDISDVNFSIDGPNTPPEIEIDAELTTRQGSPAAIGVIGSVSDVQDSAGSLAVAVSGMPSELTIEVANDAGEVTLSAAAECSLVAPTSGNRVYPLTLHVTDSGQAVSTAQVLVNVGRNLSPTLGNYAGILLGNGRTAQVTPNAAPADGNGNLTGTSVAPTTLPGGGSVSINAAGVVTITVGATTPAGNYTIRASVADSCGAQETKQFVLGVTDTIFRNGFE